MRYHPFQSRIIQKESIHSLKDGKSVYLLAIKDRNIADLADSVSSMGLDILHFILVFALVQARHHSPIATLNH